VICSVWYHSSFSLYVTTCGTGRVPNGDVHIHLTVSKLPVYLQALPAESTYFRLRSALAQAQMRMGSGEFGFCGRRLGGRTRERRWGEGAVGGGHVGFWVLLAMREVLRGMERAQGGRSQR
jgi:hypothetical protein